jgi:hypothetical protein
MSSATDHIIAWLNSAKGLDFVREIQLKASDPAIVFTSEFDAIGLDRTKLLPVVEEFCGPDSDIPKLLAIRSNVFYWVFYADETTTSLMVVSIPKKSLS